MAKHVGRGFAAIEYPTGMNQNGDPSQGNVSLVRTANRASGTDFLQLGSRSTLQNVAIQSNFCDQQTNPTATLKVCPIGLAYNNGDQVANLLRPGVLRRFLQESVKGLNAFLVLPQPHERLSEYEFGRAGIALAF